MRGEERNSCYGEYAGRCDADVHLGAHHRKISAKCRKGALGTGSKDAKANESVHVGGYRGALLLDTWGLLVSFAEMKRRVICSLQ